MPSIIRSTLTISPTVPSLTPSPNISILNELPKGKGHRVKTRPFARTSCHPNVFNDRSKYTFYGKCEHGCLDTTWEKSFLRRQSASVSTSSIFVKGKGRKGEVVSTFNHVCLALRTWSFFFLVDGGFVEKPNFAHMPEHSCRLDGGRTTAVFEPIIIGFEWPLPLKPDRIMLDRNVICVRAFVLYQLIPIHVNLKWSKSHKMIWKIQKIQKILIANIANWKFASKWKKFSVRIPLIEQLLAKCSSNIGPIYHQRLTNVLLLL